MDWLLIAIIPFLLWAISLCKVLYASQTVFFPNNDIIHKRNVLLVIAHPDDESMFFTPTILHLISKGHNLHILCMSTGDADGKGNIRREELLCACASLKIPIGQVKIIDHPNLQDGFSNIWSSSLLSKIIEEEIIANDIELLITFDGYGVSGHQNHRDVRSGTYMFLSKYPERSIEAWELISTNMTRKYIGPVDVWLSIIFARSHAKGMGAYCVINNHPCKSFNAMAQHRSQWVWFRKLFVLFSSYTYMNTLRKIEL
ncbi:hypothetical protein Syun_029954 [Stephania yunnanensis]|uniref:N-acetylglucosaminylphosphatidylinositol deacetylase n=1 Tax=Stephania yunnanensis TaxID=152371 RepID=A0AAP0E8W9_9MAGN